jgi:Uma2 family endonuclease
MAIVFAPSERVETLGDLLHRLGGISPDRVRCDPLPGRATEEDVIRAEVHNSRLCELIDGTLVEKAMGFNESLLAGALISLLRGFVIPRNLGLVSGEAGMMRILPGLVRIPDVAFVSWTRIPGRRAPDEAILPLAPDLAVEILSEGNTADEMARKRNEYFAAGVHLLWEVDPRKRTVAVYTSPGDVTVLSETQMLDGGEILPSFVVSLKDLFGELDRVGPR